uniref:Uncharacterized protein n=1 Tax=Strongyloides stercoralis TaxID=6248 RepID=A0A0K0EMW5_STRER
MLTFSIFHNRPFFLLIIGLHLLCFNILITTISADGNEKTIEKNQQQYLDVPYNDALINHLPFDNEYNVIEKRSRNPYAWSKILKRDINQGRYFFEPVSYLDIPPFVQRDEKKSRNPYSWKYSQIYGKRGRNPYSWEVNPAYQKREFTQGGWYSFRPTRNPYAWANVL